MQVHFKQFTGSRPRWTLRLFFLVFSFWCFLFGVFIFVSKVCVFLAVSGIFLLRLARYVWGHLLGTLNLDLRLSPADISLGCFHLEFSL